MNTLDVMVIVFLGAFALYGAAKGIVRLLLGSAAVLAGIALAVWLHAPLAARLPGWISGDAARRLAACAMIFCASLIAGAVLIWTIQRLLEAAKLRWMDRLFGAIVGAAAAALLAAAIMLPVMALLPARSNLIEGSSLAPALLAVSTKLEVLAPEELRRRYEAARENLARRGS